ncbi:hypothetical protein [Bacillus paranthracis]|uniref:hypothetical protein n=1 Tax=Bacillus paranthracis TaxID=2026186 RepID=UPI003D21CB5C
MRKNSKGSETVQSHPNEWISVIPLEQMTNKEYDVLIVGSGAGGGAVLWRLCEQWKNKKNKLVFWKQGICFYQLMGKIFPQ